VGSGVTVRLDETDLARLLEHAVERANQVLLGYARKHSEEAADMGSTLTLAVVEGNRATVAHVGDSRAYLYRHDRLRVLTQDHTLLLQAKRDGVLPENPSLWPPRQALSQALGASDRIEPETHELELQPGDQILLCTDGLTDMVSEKEILALLRRGEPPQKTCDELILTAIANGGKDNITALLVPIDADTN
jgi:protein phosphatase